MGKDLEELFKIWKNRQTENGDGENFTKDGILRHNNETDEELEAKWFSTERRIAILLKDQYQKDEQKWDEDIRDWLRDTDIDDEKALAQKRKNRDIEVSFLKRIAYLIWGLSKADEKNDWWYDEVDKHREEVKDFFNTQPFALVECKKMPGEGKLDDKILKKHLRNYGDLLKKELEILKPNFIVCTSSLIYDAVVKSYPQEKVYTIEGHNSIRIIKGPRGGIEALVFCSYHPSTPGTADKFHEGVMVHYRAFLKNVGLSR